jgi:glycosyltransferase involved in cell wall biosynthesis
MKAAALNNSRMDSVSGAVGEKRRLLFLNLHTEMGGGEFAVYHLVRCLDARRWDSVMVFSGPGSFLEKTKSLGCATVIVPFPAVMVKRLLIPAELARAIRSARQMHRLIRDREIDLICCSDIVILLLIAVPALIRRVPVVYTVIFFHEWMRMVLFNLLALMLVDVIVANSALLADDIRKKTLGLHTKIRINEPGVDHVTFRPLRFGEENRLRREMKLGADIKIVGMIARFDRVKRHADYIRAAAEVIRRRTDVFFVVVGDDINSAVIPSLVGYRTELMEAAEQAGLGGRLRFLGYRTDVADLVRGLDLLVSPSVKEGFGLVVLEGLASGVPVVVSRSSGVWETVKSLPGVAGSIPGDTRSLSAQIFAMLDRPKDKGIDTAVRQLTWERYSRRMEELYDAVFLRKGTKFSSTHWSTTI